MEKPDLDDLRGDDDEREPNSALALQVGKNIYITIINNKCAKLQYMNIFIYSHNGNMTRHVYS